MRATTSALAVLVAAGMSASAFGDYSIVQQSAAARTYTGFQIDFDQPGDPGGLGDFNPIDGSFWQATHGITFEAGVGGGGGVEYYNDFYLWGLGEDKSHSGAFGTFLTFDSDIREISFQAWDGSGPPSGFGGGMGVILMDDGVEVAFDIVTPAWGGLGNTWYNITTTGSDRFDEIRLINFGFSDGVFTDNYSWNVPAPGALGLMALAGVGSRRRRRR